MKGWKRWIKFSFLRLDKILDLFFQDNKLFWLEHRSQSVSAGIRLNDYFRVTIFDIWPFNERRIFLGC